MMPSCALTAFNSNDKHLLARNAIELAAARRKPINSYGTYLSNKRQWDQRHFAGKQDPNSQLIRQYSTGSAFGMFPNRMQSQQQMMYGQQGGASKQFNVSTNGHRCI
jgi:hypothetical protein